MIFSVLVPVYNADEYLHDCIESILKQTEKSFEILLLDDGSSDNSGTICDTYAAKYPDKIKTFHSIINNGQLLTRRKLFEQAQGKWIVCVDSDDYIAEDALERIKNTFEHYRTDMVIYNLMCIQIDGRKETFRPSLKPNVVYDNTKMSKIYKALSENRYLNSLCTKAFKKDVIDKDVDYSIWKEIKIGEDLFQSYPLWDNCERIVYIDETLYYYRKNITSITSHLPKDFYKMRKILWERDDYYAKKWGTDNKTIEIVLRQRISEIINYIRTIVVKEQTLECVTYISEIKEDGILMKYISSIHKRISVRERIISILVLKNRIRLLYAFCNIEQKIKTFLE